MRRHQAPLGELALGCSEFTAVAMAEGGAVAGFPTYTV